MKTQVFDPFTAVQKSGGCTFEPERGWWTQTTPEQASELGRPFSDERDAAYIPTLQKNGQPVPEEVVAEVKARATELGLTTLTRAAGMWVLSETGEVQTETIWIAHGKTKNGSLTALAQHIKAAANQDCVAWENGGELHFTN